MSKSALIPNLVPQGNGGGITVNGVVNFNYYIGAPVPHGTVEELPEEPVVSQPARPTRVHGGALSRRAPASNADPELARALRESEETSKREEQERKQLNALLAMEESRAVQESLDMDRKRKEQQERLRALEEEEAQLLRALAEAEEEKLREAEARVQALREAQAQPARPAHQVLVSQDMPLSQKRMPRTVTSEPAKKSTGNGSAHRSLLLAAKDSVHRHHVKNDDDDDDEETKEPESPLSLPASASEGLSAAAAALGRTIGLRLHD